MSIFVLLRPIYSRSSPNGKAVGEDVPMDDNPAYGEVNIYDTSKKELKPSNISHCYQCVYCISVPV